MNQSKPEDYVDLLLRSGLINRGKLMKFISDLEAEVGTSPVDKQLLAKKLIDAGLITSWQHDKLRRGRFAGFFLGKYKLLSILGKGGMGAVYLAEHAQLNRRVAIKILPPALLENAAFLARFKQEARATASLDHPNIVRAYDVDQDGAYHYLVMEYVVGLELQQLVERKGQLPFRDIARYIGQACDGLQHAHNRGMIHRDIKPANLLVTNEGQIKILDLGVARIVDQDDKESVTLAHNEDVIGTVDYIAPEQLLDSHNVDNRADLYSLGCTMYFLLTGKRPFEEGTWAVRLMKHQNSVPPAIELLRPDTPPGLIAICQKMMSKQPKDRPQSASEVAQYLATWLEKGDAAVAAPKKEGPNQAALEAVGLGALGSTVGAMDASASNMLFDTLVAQGVLTKFQAEVLTGRSQESMKIDDYQLFDRIDKGRLKGIYRGRHQELKFPVCLKVTRLGGEAHEKKMQMARFQRETRIAVQVHHPNVVRTYELGKDVDLCYLTLEDLQMESLMEMLVRGQPFSIESACRIILQATQGLAHMHEMEIVHRCLSPHNILVGEDGHVKLFDLSQAIDSLAHLDPPGLEELKVQDTEWGSLDYMAPEQGFDPKAASPASDVYSLGCTIYHLLTGRVPFTADSPSELMMQHAASPPIPPIQLNDKIPPDLNAVVLKMMSKSKTQRYPSAAEVLEALKPFAE